MAAEVTRQSGPVHRSLRLLTSSATIDCIVTAKAALIAANKLATSGKMQENAGMDAPTVSFYEARAQEWASQHRGVYSPAAEICKVWLRPGCTILDVGSGSGRDMAALLLAGFAVYGLEPAAALIAEAEAAYPLLKGRIFRGSLPGDLPPDRVFSAVLCSAMLMHVPAGQSLDAVRALRRLLRPSGRAIVFVSTGRQVDPLTERDAEGRLFHEPTPEAVQSLFEQVGFRMRHLQTTPDQMGRTQLEWHLFVFEAPAAAPLPAVSVSTRPAQN